MTNSEKSENLPSNLQMFRQKAGDLVFSKSLEEVADAFEETVYINPSSSNAYEILNDGTKFNDQDIAVLHSYFMEIMLSPDSLEFYELLGDYYYKERHFVQAFNSYMLALPTYASSSVSQKLLNSLQQISESNQLKLNKEVKDFEEEADNWDRYKGNKIAQLNSHRFYLDRGRDLSVQGHWKEALESYKKQVATNFFFEEARSYLFELQKAWVELEASVQIFPRFSNFKAGQNLTSLVRGICAVKQGRLDLALHYFQAVLSGGFLIAESYFCIASVLYNYGIVNGESSYIRRAIVNYQESISANPSIAETHLCLGNAIQRQAKKMDELNRAIGCWQEAIKLKPSLIEAYEKLILVKGYYQTQFKEAIDLKKLLIDQRKFLLRTNSLSGLRVRFLPSNWLRHIGHFITLDILVKANLLGSYQSYYYILPVIPETTANPHFLNYWRKYSNFICILTDPDFSRVLSPLSEQMKALGFGCEEESMLFPLRPTLEFNYGEIQRRWEVEKRPPLLTLSKLDFVRGWECLKNFGMSEEDWFVSLHVREGGFYREGENSWSCCRNADIGTYIAAIEAITERGGWVIRMGDSTMKPLEKMFHVIDYAHSGVKSDWLDVFLWAQCRFFVGTASGPLSVPPCFGVPRVVTNYPFALYLPFQVSSNDIAVPKLYWHREQARYLTFSEMLSSPICHSAHCGHLSMLGVQVVDNTSEEIADTVVEMLDWICEKVRPSPVNRDDPSYKLSKLFEKVCKLPCRIGKRFAEKHKDLLSY